MHPFVPTFTVVERTAVVPVHLANPDAVWGTLQTYHSEGRVVFAPTLLCQDVETVTKLVDCVSNAIQNEEASAKVFLVQENRCLVSLHIYKNATTNTLNQEISLLLSPQAAQGVDNPVINRAFAWVPGPEWNVDGTTTIYTEGGPTTIADVARRALERPLDVSNLTPIMTSVTPLKLDWEFQLASAVVHFVDAVAVHNGLLRLLRPGEIFNIPTFQEAVAVLRPTHVYVPLLGKPMWKPLEETVPTTDIGLVQKLMDQTTEIDTFILGHRLSLNVPRVGFLGAAKMSDTRAVWRAHNELTAPINLVARRALRRAPGRHIANCVLQCFADVRPTSLWKSGLYTGVFQTRRGAGSQTSVLCMVEVLHLLVVHNMVEVLTDAGVGVGVGMEMGTMVLRQQPHLNALLTLLSTLCVSYVDLKAPFSSVAIGKPSAQVPGGPSMQVCSVLAMVLVKLVESLSGLEHASEAFSFFLYTNTAVLYGLGAQNEVSVTDFDAGTKTVIWKGKLDGGGQLLVSALQVVTKLLFAMGVQGIIFMTHDVRKLYGNSLIWKACRTQDRGLDGENTTIVLKQQSTFMLQFWGDMFITALDRCTCATAGGDPDIAVDLTHLHPDLEDPGAVLQFGANNQRRRKHTEALWR